MSPVLSRPRRVVAALAAVASAATAASAFAVLSDAQAAAPSGHVVRWVGVKEASTQPKHPRLGQSWTVYRGLYEEKGDRLGRRVGESSSRCSAVYVTDNGFISQCQGVVRTEDGSLVMGSMQNRFGPGPYRGVSAVTGGTGAYRGVSGEAWITRRENSTLFEIHLER